MFRFILVAFLVIRATDGLGELSRNPAITFLSARSGWRIYEANTLAVNPNLSIAPTSVSLSANQRAVLLNFGNGQDPILGLATVGAFRGSQLNRRHGIYKNRAYDLDSVIISPVPVENTTNNNTAVPATPISLTFIPTHSQTNQCMVARVRFGGSNTVDGVITNIDTIGGGGATCAIFVRNSTDTALLDAREIRRCELGLRKCSRAFKRTLRENNDFELTTLTP
ncbi:uncharacterized protein LOC114828041 [Galendromus occidentalis]|uniref:Uncharacterized protein LOC114828041 n=1 Tax=Galendromus occidentalis TaxID=34638 RepID=A0AAJ7SEA0_9ACAR|nr:uncharacterized protein LOC114828041 [Galendromus occidentalis]